MSCPTLCDPLDCNLPGSSIHGIFQARILEWVPVPFSRGSSQFKDQTQVSHVAGGFFTSWATREAQEYWSGYPVPSQQIFPTQESNWGLPHCRRILYQLSYKGSPTLIFLRKTLHNRVERASWLVTISTCWEGGVPEEGWILPLILHHIHPPPYSSSSIWLLWVVSFMTNP